MLHRLGFWSGQRIRTAAGTPRTSAARCASAPTRARRCSTRIAARTTSSNLFVVDASFFPSSAAVNPGLTIAAQALRVADHIRENDLRTLQSSRRAGSAVEHAAAPPITVRIAGRGKAMKARSFSHVGITVSDFNRAVQFYWDVFGCPLVGVADTPPDRVRSFFGVDGRAAAHARSAGSACRAARCSRSSSSSRSCRRGAIPWNRVGLTHFSFNVQRTRRSGTTICVSKGVECVSKPETLAARPLVLLCQGLRRQPDRDDGSRLHALRPRSWLGPLGGWLFRRGMYKRYYGA